MQQGLMAMQSLAEKIGDAPAIHVAKQVVGNISVTREGTLVAMKIGNTTLRMPWATAMTVGQWLMSRAFEGKVLDGEHKRLTIEPDRTSK